MQREIRFRAWDKERNMFVPYGEIIFKNHAGETSIEVLPNCMEYIGDKVHNGEPQYSRFNIQQFTGLKDKNGVDIYEGDVLQEENNSLCFVVWFKVGYAVQSPGSESIDIEYSSYYYKVKVIGNIHDNPELIK